MCLLYDRHILIHQNHSSTTVHLEIICSNVTVLGYFSAILEALGNSPCYELAQTAERLLSFAPLPSLKISICSFLRIPIRRELQDTGQSLRLSLCFWDYCNFWSFHCKINCNHSLSCIAKCSLFSTPRVTPIYNNIYYDRYQTTFIRILPRKIHIQKLSHPVL